MFVFIIVNLYGINVLSIYHSMHRYDMHNNMFVEESIKVILICSQDVAHVPSSLSDICSV